MRIIFRRRMWFVLRDQPLACPDGHRMREDTIVLEHAGIRCKHRPPPSGLECGAFVWVLLMPGGTRFVAEVTIDELRHMQTVSMSVEQSLLFLGATRPLVAAS